MGLWPQRFYTLSLVARDFFVNIGLQTTTMIAFANAKINIGLQVLRRREDSYHDLETVFYPVGIHDVVEVIESSETRFFSSGVAIPQAASGNLCLRAYELIRSQVDIPPVDIYLHKVIPVGAGLGGGSSDAAAILRLLNDLFAIGFSDSALMAMASQLGADCAFFLRNRPVFATGIGDVFADVSVSLAGYHLVIVKPDIHIATADAYRGITPRPEGNGLAQAIRLPVAAWKERITNDFEAGVFSRHPAIGKIKADLYEAGALYAAMSGSGSAVFGIFEKPVALGQTMEGHQVFHIDSE